MINIFKMDKRYNCFVVNDIQNKSFRNGYKGYSKGLVCHGYEYKENTIYKKHGSGICSSGVTHYCINPFDVLSYYDIINNIGELNEFTFVKASGNIYTDCGKKFSTDEIHILNKINIIDFIKNIIEYNVFSKNRDEDITILSPYSCCFKNELSSVFITSNESKNIILDMHLIKNTSFNSKMIFCSPMSNISNIGNSSTIINLANGCKINNISNETKIFVSEEKQIINSIGDENVIYVYETSNKNEININGDCNFINCRNKDNNICIKGLENRFKGVKDTVITYINTSINEFPKFKRLVVDDINIKSDTWYEINKYGEVSFYDNTQFEF